MAAPHTHKPDHAAAWSRRQWMLRANTPVACWLIILPLTVGAAAAGHMNSWIPVHILGIGVITTSIMVWSQYFTARFTGHRPTRAHQVRQLYRIWTVTVGTVLILGGQLPDTPSTYVSVMGATLTTAGMVLHGISLGKQYLESDKTRRFRPIVAVYVLATICLLGGITAGILLTIGVPGAWPNRLRSAHLILNLPGFVGLTAFGSLTLMFPAVWRTRGRPDHTSAAATALVCGVSVAVSGTLCGTPGVLGTGLLIYAAGWIIAAVPWMGNVRDVLTDPRDRLTFAAVAVVAAPAWLIIGILRAAVEVFLGSTVAFTLPVLPLLIGFGAQLLIGVLSFLVPSIIGGGPAAVRRGMGVLDSLGLLRATLLNGSLALRQFESATSIGPAPALLIALSLGAFLPLTATAVVLQRQRLQRAHDPGTPATATGRHNPAYGQIVTGLVILGILIIVALSRSQGISGGTPGAPDASHARTTDVALQSSPL
ncbi:hypothetical protein [Corynebacterium sp. CCM 9204]|uniref:hypothetical protein n=1 Tax=Corynebacterium sp. CCM 9204 TaxID=3057616 RepID=UPI003524654C